MAFGSTRVGE